MKYHLTAATVAFIAGCSVAFAQTAVEPPPAEHARVCAGQTTPVCSGKIVGKWINRSGSSETTTWTFSADGVLTTDSSRKPSTNVRWRIEDPHTVIIDLGAEGGPLKEMRAQLPREVLSIIGITRTGNKAPGGAMIFLPVEDAPPPNRSTLPVGVWTMGAQITPDGETQSIPSDRLKMACSNSFVVSQRDGSSQYYFLDHEKGVLLNRMLFTRQGECQPKGHGKEICTFRMPDKIDTLEGSPEYFDDGTTLVYRDRVHADWPMQRVHRCPFSIEAAKPIIEPAMKGSWSSGMKSWQDLYSILSGPGDYIFGPKAVIAEHTRLFYRFVQAN